MLDTREWLPWYFILWRAIWWVPTFTALALFCILVSLYSLDIEAGRDAWEDNT